MREKDLLYSFATEKAQEGQKDQKRPSGVAKLAPVPLPGLKSFN